MVTQVGRRKQTRDDFPRQFVSKVVPAATKVCDHIPPARFAEEEGQDALWGRGVSGGGGARRMQGHSNTAAGLELLQKQ